MLSNYGIPLLRGLHRATYRAFCELSRFEDYLYRWRQLVDPEL